MVLAKRGDKGGKWPPMLDYRVLKILLIADTSHVAIYGRIQPTSSLAHLLLALRY
jgi:hypothetical protein